MKATLNTNVIFEKTDDLMEAFSFSQSMKMKLKGTEIDIKELDETISKGATFKPALLL